MRRTWDLWLESAMVLAICPAMHFGLVGFAELSEPTKDDLQQAWDVTFEPDYAILVSDVEADDEEFPLGLQGDDSEIN